MIDTVVLKIDNPAFFSVENVELKKKVGHGFTKQYFTPTAKQVGEYGYLPRVWLITAVRSGGYQTFSQIEFSLPKLLFGNNFQEVSDSDFNTVCVVLMEKLAKIGLKITTVEALKDAGVSVVHYSKNIILQDYTTPYTYIKELSKANISKIYDFNQTDYRNEGHALRYRANGYEVIFYDKIKDLEQAKKSERRAIETDSSTQFDIYERLKQKRPFEVFRMEVRLSNRRKIKVELAKHGYNKSLIFKELFSEQVSRSVLLSVIRDVENLTLPSTENDNYADLLSQIQILNPSKSLSQCLSFMSAMLIINQSGSRELRAIVERFSPTSWYRLNRKIQEFLINQGDNKIIVLRKALENFKQVKLEDYL